MAATTQPNCAPATSIDVVRCLTALPDAQAIEAHAEANGHFSINVPIPPALAPGTSVLVRAAINAPPYGDLVLQSAWYSVIPLSIAPTLTLDRQTGPAGTTVAVSGNHWPSSKLVIVEYCRSEAVSQSPEGIACNQGSLGVVTTGYAQELGETTVDTSGHFNTHVTLPSNARPGSVMFQVRVKITDPTDGIYAIYAQTASFTVTKVKTDQQATAPWWPFAAAGGILVILIGLVLWRRGALPACLGR